MVKFNVNAIKSLCLEIFYPFVLVCFFINRCDIVQSNSYRYLWITDEIVSVWVKVFF